MRYQIFDVQAIHGITSRGEDLHGDSVLQKVVVWGGRSLAFGKLKFQKDVHNRNDIQYDFLIDGSIDVDDWILRTIIPNRESDHLHEALLLTAKNTLLRVIESADDHVIQVITIAKGPRSFLYSGFISIVSEDFIIVASGTVFGEILVWTCHQHATSSNWITTLRHIFTGHKGSIFGVCISDIFTIDDCSLRLLASCSDDRTIRIWDISDCDKVTTTEISKVESTVTGFGGNGNDSKSCSAWGHLSRIWDAVFLPLESTDDKSVTHMISRGEDGACQLWTLDLIAFLKNKENALKVKKINRHHSGKNIWSMAIISNSDLIQVYTGGADGQILSHKFWPSWTEPIQNFQIIKSFASIIPGKGLRNYLLLDQFTTLATTDTDDLLLGSLKKGTTFWQKIHEGVAKSNLVLPPRIHSGTAFVGNGAGELFVLARSLDSFIRLPHQFDSAITSIHVLYQAQSLDGLSTDNLLFITHASRSDAVILQVKTHKDNIDLTSCSIPLPTTFIVTSTVFDKSSELLALGSRSGALALYQNVNLNSNIEPICFRHVHDSDSITSILILPTNEQSDQDLYLLTTARDGTYAVHHIRGIRSSTLSLTTVHSSTPSFGPYIEGAYLIQNQNETESDLILYGFRSKDFVIWNETQQKNILSIECGGAHRSWSYKHDFDTITFIWTKAGHFNLTSNQSIDYGIVRHGGHGREIKAIATSPNVYNGNSLIATGAEDTTIRLFSVTQNQNQDIKCITTIKGHKTGLQDLAFSNCGSYLFSSAGLEELLVWKLAMNIPCIGIGATLQDQLPTETGDSDVRILSIDIKQDQEYPKFFIGAAYSNGKAKVISYIPGQSPGKGRFDVLNVIVHGSFCLMQVRSLVNDDMVRMQMLTAGTNGYLNFNRILSPDNVSTKVHRLHQSSVLSMDVIKTNPDQWTIATAGDDNSVGLTIMTTTESQIRFESILIPKAHAAAVTSLALLNRKSDTNQGEIILVTTGNDQRIKVWKILIPSKNDALEQLNTPLQIQKLAECWTSIADVGGIRVLPTLTELKEEKVRLITVGVGMEILEFPLKE